MSNSLAARRGTSSDRYVRQVDEKILKREQEKRLEILERDNHTIIPEFESIKSNLNLSKYGLLEEKDRNYSEFFAWEAVLIYFGLKGTHPRDLISRLEEQEKRERTKETVIVKKNICVFVAGSNSLSISFHLKQ